MRPTFEIEVCDNLYEVVITFGVIEAWEQRVSQKQFWDQIDSPRVSVLTWLFYCAIKHGSEEKAPTYEDIGEWMLDERNQVYAGELAVNMMFAGYNRNKWPEVKKKIAAQKAKRSEQEKTSSASESSEVTTE